MQKINTLLSLKFPTRNFGKNFMGMKDAKNKKKLVKFEEKLEFFINKDNLIFVSSEGE